MNVLLDGTVFGNGFQKGIQRYVCELITYTSDTVMLMNHLPGVITTPDVIQANVLPAYRKRVPLKNLPLRLWRSYQRRTATNGFYVYHTPYIGITPRKNLPSVMVVHDMVCERFPQHFAADAAMEVKRKKKAMDAASLLIAISQATADDLLAIYPQYAGRVRVIHHGSEHLAQDDSETPSTSVDQPYVLFVGDRVGYKNFSAVLASMCESLWPDDLMLMVAGPPATVEELASIRNMGLEHKVHLLGRVTDRDLMMLYRNASCFLFPSLHEGFGFPMIEAQKCGTPVAASRIPVFMEIGGNAFEPFDPLDPSSMAKAVANTLDPSISSMLRRNGIENAARFSWKQTAAKTSAVWHEAANQ